MSERQYHDDLFGLLIFDEQFKTWHGNLQLADQTVALEVYASPNGTVSDSMRQAFLMCQANGFDYRDAAAARMLEVYNQNWNNDEPIDAATFAHRLTLEQIVVQQDGTIVLWHNDGDLFAGHVILVEINPQGVVTRAELMG